MKQEYVNERVDHLISAYIHSARDRAILRDNLIDGLSYGELAQRYNLSYDGVKKIIRKGKQTIFKYY